MFLLIGGQGPSYEIKGKREWERKLDQWECNNVGCVQYNKAATTRAVIKNA